MNSDQNGKGFNKSDLWRLLKSLNDRTVKSEYKFWTTQPVPKLSEEFDDNVNEPFVAENNVEDVRKEPYRLPEGYEWIDMDIKNVEDRNEIFMLLSENYVEDNDCIFRFYYSPEFLLWALSAPKYLKNWHVGVKYKRSNKLVGFISGIPANICVNKKEVKMAEVNFLCVHKTLRSKRLAPVLIREITRRVNLQNIWQAFYTAGVYLPKPLGTAKYFHRSLNVKKLIEVGFSSLNTRLTMSRAIKLYRVDEELSMQKLRKLEKKDIPSLLKLLNSYLEKFKIHINFTKEEIEHWFLPRKKVIYSFVNVEDGEVKDLISFYSLPSQVLGNSKHDLLNAAYGFYNIATTVDFKTLMNNAITLAKKNEFDVLNILDIMENKTILSDLKFCEGDGTLKYYLYNWKCKTMEPSDIGLVLL